MAADATLNSPWPQEFRTVKLFCWQSGCQGSDKKVRRWLRCRMHLKQKLIMQRFCCCIEGMFFLACENVELKGQQIGLFIVLQGKFLLLSWVGFMGYSAFLSALTVANKPNQIPTITFFIYLMHITFGVHCWWQAQWWGPYTTYYASCWPQSVCSFRFKVIWKEILLLL